MSGSRRQTVVVLLALIIVAEVSVVAVQYLTAEAYPSRAELGRRTLVSIRPGMTADDLLCVVGAPTFKEPSERSGHMTAIWVYRPWPSMAAYVEINKAGTVISVRFVPT